MTREENLYTMTGEFLIQEADKLGVKVACNKTRTSLKEAKAKVIARILEAEAKITETEEPTEVETEEPIEETTETITEESTIESEAISEEPKQKAKVKHRKSNLKLTELTYNGETKSIRAWAAEIGMPWPTLYDRVNRNGWTVEDAIEIPLGQRRPR